MTVPLTVSVVIVSRGRPEALKRCLTGVMQLFYRPFEVVIVADPAGCAAVQPMAQSACCKIIAFDEPNISAARNLGVAAAAGEIVAFIDDDAVPEPTWLGFLTFPFGDPQVAAAGGFVRGRNGISWQSRASTVDRTGWQDGITVNPDHATVLTPTPDHAIKTEGTNMAFRRAQLAAIGGFDPAFRFFLDETDVNLRLAALGLCTAIVPHAEVHHGYAASARRRADRVPTDLFEIGASWAVFLRKHCPPDRLLAVLNRVRLSERKRALSLMIRGGLEPRDVRRLMSTLENGFLAGQARAILDLPAIPSPDAGFQPVPTQPRDKSDLIAGRSWQRSPLRSRAQKAVASGNILTVLRFSMTTLYHRLQFLPEGYWEQTGGIFGKTERKDRWFRYQTFAKRCKSEADRIRIVRGLGD